MFILFSPSVVLFIAINKLEACLTPDLNPSTLSLRLSNSNFKGVFESILVVVF